MLSLATLVLSAVVVQGTAPVTSLASVRAIHIAGMAEMIGPDRQIAGCLVEKLKAQGPFTFPEAVESADAVLTWSSKIPSGSSRVLWGKSPEIRATLTDREGRQLWTGSNKYKKSTTAWGANTSIPCGLANGLVDKLVKDMLRAKK